MIGGAGFKKKESLPLESTFLVTLALFLVIRTVIFGVYQEPYSDEGLWLWNARCDYFGVPHGYVLHSALSPLNYYFCRVVFFFTTPSLLSIRLANVFIFFAALIILYYFYQKQNRRSEVIVLLALLLIDPFLPRHISWAQLESRYITFVILHQLLIVHFRNRLGLILLVLVDVSLLATKILSIWVLSAAFLTFFVYGFRRRAFIYAGLTIFGTLLTYGVYYLSLDVAHQNQFVWVWQIHGKLHEHNPLITQNLFHLSDKKTLFYISMLFVFVVTYLFKWRRAGFEETHCFLAVAGGILTALSLTFFPARYQEPIAIMGALGLVRIYADFIRKYFLVVSCGLFLLVVGFNALFIKEYIFKSKLYGGNHFREVLQEKAEKGLKIAAPPYLCIDIPGVIHPTSCTLLDDGTTLLDKPDIFVFCGNIAVSQTDHKYLEDFRSEGREPMILNVYHYYSREKVSD